MQHPTPPVPVQVIRQTILQDFIRAGVTDVTAAQPCDWAQPLRPAASPITSPIISPNVALPTRVPNQHSAPRNRTAPSSAVSTGNTVSIPPGQTKLHGQPQRLLILTGGTALHTPFTPDESVLLSNMLRALRLDFALDPNDTGILLHVGDGADAVQLGDFLPTPPPLCLALGGDGAKLLLGDTSSLSKAQAMARISGFQPQRLHCPCGATFHPRTLLKQPVLKAQAWQDLLHWQYRF